MSIFEMKIRHDQHGRVVEKTESVKDKSVNWMYAYDSKGRLSEAHLDGRLICQCYYDGEGRRQQDYFPATHGSQYRNYTYTIKNRLQQAGNNTYTHNDAGFRSIWSSGGRYTLYEYSTDHRLLKAEVEDESEVYEYSHDSNGQREVKYFNGKMVEAYKWLDFTRLAAFHDGESGYSFAYQENARTPYAMQREDGAGAYLYYDQIGSLRVVADESDNVIKEILYDPFGGIIEDTNPGLRIPIGFAGGLHDRDLGFVRFGWRDYDTYTGRWTAPDPIGDAGGDPDWYGYCLDDPVNMSDPTGLRGKAGAGRRIVTSGLVEGAKGAAIGGMTLGTPGAIAGGAIMTPVGMLKGAIKEYPPIRKKLDKAKGKLIYELTDGRAKRMKQTRLLGND